MKRFTRWCVALALTIAIALATALLAPPTIDAQSEPEPTIECTIHVFAQKDCESVRIEAVADMVVALESFAAANGTYLVDGSGFRGGGTGWTFWESAGTTYPVAIARVLADEGHLPADTADSLGSNSNAIEGDLLTYRCQDRVAVFTRNSTTEPSPNDRDWWADNNCTTYPITNVNATYFQVSVPLSLTGPLVGCTIHVFADPDCGTARIDAVADLVAALESYAAANGTYRVEGSGFRGGGTGFMFWGEEGSDSPVAIAMVLTNEGHLPADNNGDPLWSSNGISGDLLTYRCHDRVAVFTRNSTTEPSPNDRDWWADNDCTTYPINRLNATYYELSTHLPAQ